MYTCQFCSTSLKKAFTGTFKGEHIHSCSSCFKRFLSPIEFDQESVYYPNVGRREIQIEDYIVMYDTNVNEVVRIPLKTYEEGLIGLLKEDLSQDIQIDTKDILVVIEPWNTTLVIEE